MNNFVATMTPMRISFVGGGTDFKEYYQINNGGAVLNAAINKYVYIIINKYHDPKKCLLKYSKRFSDIHIGMLHVLDVPGFEYILIHCGNTDEHTAGCLLVGDSQENNQITKDGFIGKSTQAYKRIYPRIAEAIDCGEEVTITYKTI